MPSIGKDPDLRDGSQPNVTLSLSKESERLPSLRQVVGEAYYSQQGGDSGLMNDPTPRHKEIDFPGTPFDQQVFKNLSNSNRLCDSQSVCSTDPSSQYVPSLDHKNVLPHRQLDNRDSRLQLQGVGTSRKISPDKTSSRCFFNPSGFDQCTITSHMKSARPLTPANSSTPSASRPSSPLILDYDPISASKYMGDQRRQWREHSNKYRGNLRKKLNKADQDIEFYRNERNFFRQLLIKSNVHLPPRPKSPRSQRG